MRQFMLTTSALLSLLVSTPAAASPTDGVLQVMAGRQVHVELVSGLSVTGELVGSADNMMLIARADGKLVELSRNEVDEVRGVSVKATQHGAADSADTDAVVDAVVERAPASPEAVVVTPRTSRTAHGKTLSRDVLPRVLDFDGNRLYVDGVRIKGGVDSYLDFVVRESTSEEAKRLMRRRTGHLIGSASVSGAMSIAVVAGAPLGLIDIGIISGVAIGAAVTGPTRSKIGRAYNEWAASRPAGALAPANAR